MEDAKNNDECEIENATCTVCRIRKDAKTGFYWVRHKESGEKVRMKRCKKCHYERVLISRELKKNR